MAEEKNQVPVSASTFADAPVSRLAPIQAALQLPLVQAIGTVFKLEAGETEVVTDYTDRTKKTKRAVYTVRVLSQKVALPLGTIIKVRIKDAESIITREDNEKLLIGAVKPPIVAFDRLNHWFMNNQEGLNASNIRILDIPMEKAIQL